MRLNWLRSTLFLVPLLIAALSFAWLPAGLSVHAQQPTGTIPTVTSTPTGPIVTVTYGEQINVRSGPSSFFYPAIGVLLVSQSAPALGRSPGGDWIMIAYPGVPGNVGWVYAPLVSLTPGFLPIIDPPPTPTPLATATINPTLAAAYIVPQTPTRLPTFTPPAPLVMPSFGEDTTAARTARVPAGLVITSLALIGIFGGIISFLRGR